MKTKEAMRTQFLIQLFFLIISITPVNAQTIESWIESKEKIPAEKIYVHTDSERYFAGDTLWFKVYLIDSRSGQLLPGVENVYVNLISESGESVTRAILLSRNGQAVGRFVIHDKFKSGNYLLQVHTNYLLNFGSQAFFYQHIPISTISGSSRMITRSNPSGNMIADVKFLPEGEVLLENSTNLVAFKAVDRYGFGVDVSGKIKDEKGTVVTTFASDYKGMGLLFLMPESNKKYYATIDGFMSYRYEFEPVKNRYKIQLPVQKVQTDISFDGAIMQQRDDQYQYGNQYYFERS